VEEETVSDPNYVPSPLHYQLSKNLQEEINSGKFKQGDLFATEKSLMARFNLSSTTVRRALQDLVHKGYLYRKPGKGTFVRRPFIEEPLGLLSSFFEEMEAQGIKPSSDVLTLKAVQPGSYVSEKMLLKSDDPVFLIRKLMKANGEPMAVFDSYWPLKIGKALAKYDLTTTGIFSVVEGVLGISLGEAEGTIEAAAPTRKEARMLRIPLKTPVLVKKQIIYSSDGKPVNIVRLAYRGDRYKFRVRMVRQPGKYISKGISAPHR
jgi:GntR family transcriptional regulator